MLRDQPSLGKVYYNMAERYGYKAQATRKAEWPQSSAVKGQMCIFEAIQPQRRAFWVTPEFGTSQLLTRRTRETMMKTRFKKAGPRKPQRALPYFQKAQLKTHKLVSLPLVPLSALAAGLVYCSTAALKARKSNPDTLCSPPSRAIQAGANLAPHSGDSTGPLVITAAGYSSASWLRHLSR